MTSLTQPSNAYIRSFLTGSVPAASVAILLLLHVLPSAFLRVLHGRLPSNDALLSDAIALLELGILLSHISDRKIRPAHIW